MKKLLILFVVASAISSLSHAMTAEKCQSIYDERIADIPKSFSSSLAGRELREIGFDKLRCMDSAAKEKETGVAPTVYTIGSVGKNGQGATLRSVTSDEVEELRVEEKRKREAKNAKNESEASERGKIALQQRKEDELRHIAEEEKRVKEEALNATPQYRRAEALRQIEIGNRIIVNGYALIAEEKRIGRISGYENGKRLYDLGAYISMTEKVNAMQRKIIADIDLKN